MGKLLGFLMERRVLVAQFLPFFSGILDSVLLILVQVEDTFQFNNTSYMTTLSLTVRLLPIFFFFVTRFGNSRPLNLVGLFSKVEVPENCYFA